MENVIGQIPFGEAFEKEALKNLKELGFTSVQVYVFWKDFEPEYNKFDWSFYDREVELIKEAGLKWVPFIIMGPRYAAPLWRIVENDFVALKCLEHNKECPIESIWNENFKEHVSRVLSVFADHYLPMDVIESVQPGICGDYGEAIFPVLGNWPGAYHTHQGFWCGGEDAILDYRKYLKEKYEDIHKLNKAWRSYYASFDEIVPVLRHRAASRTAHFDMVTWYRKSMSLFSRFWMKECKKAFGEDMPCYLCTGGLEAPEQGACFSDQAKYAAENNSGLRLTNECNKFYQNIVYTLHTWSACDFYGAYLGLEPVGPITSRGFRERLFGSLSYGNRQIHHYYGNLYNENQELIVNKEDWQFYVDNAKTYKHKKSIAIFYPMDRGVLDGVVPEIYNESVKYLRSMFPISLINEEMVLDGALNEYDTLIMLYAESTRDEVLLKIVDWANTKGKSIVTNGVVRNIELEEVPSFNALFGINKDSELAYGHTENKIRKVPTFDRVAEIDEFHCETSYINLDKDVVYIGKQDAYVGYSNTQVADSSCLFMKETKSGCKCIMYTSYCDLVVDKDAMFGSNLVFPKLLEDVAALSGIKRFVLTDNQVAKADFDGRELILTDEKIIIN